MTFVPGLFLSNSPVDDVSEVALVVAGGDALLSTVNLATMRAGIDHRLAEYLENQRPSILLILSSSALR